MIQRPANNGSDNDDKLRRTLVRRCVFTRLLLAVQTEGQAALSICPCHSCSPKEVCLCSTCSTLWHTQRGCSWSHVRCDNCSGLPTTTFVLVLISSSVKMKQFHCIVKCCESGRCCMNITEQEEGCSCTLEIPSVQPVEGGHLFPASVLSFWSTG